jgi:DNA-binding CsgD family transcriptional regulator
MSSINTSSLTVRAIAALYKLTGSRERTAALLGISGPTVIRVLKDAGRATKSPGRPNEQLRVNNLIAAYWGRNESLREIAVRAGVTHTTVANHMQKFGIPTR